MGNPRTDKHIVITGYSQTSVRALEALSTTANKLALGLTDILFTKDELSSSLVTVKEDRNLLNPDKILTRSKESDVRLYMYLLATVFCPYDCPLLYDCYCPYSWVLSDPSFGGVGVSVEGGGIASSPGLLIGGRGGRGKAWYPLHAHMPLLFKF